MKKASSIIFLLFVSIFLFQQSAFAYILSEVQYVKVRGEYQILNQSGGTMSAKIETIVANQEQTPYSSFLDERHSGTLIEIKKLDDKGNRTKVIDMGYIKHNETGIVNYEYLLKIAFVDYELNPTKTQPIGNYPSSIHIYLNPSDKIESDHPSIIQKANEIKQSLPKEQQSNPYYLTRAIYGYVQTNMSYTYDNNFRNKGALFALTYLVGNCEDYSSLMVALLRANKIPARTVTGYRMEKEVLSKNEIDLHDERNYTRHMWVEAYINGYGWVAFDPTFVLPETETIQVKDYKGNPYLLNGKPAIIEVYKSLPQPAYGLFGKLDNYYIKERYDLNDFSNKAWATRSPASLAINWYAQLVPYSTFDTISKIYIDNNISYSDKPIQLVLKGVIQSKEIVIPNESVNWLVSDSSIASIENGFLTFHGREGLLTISAYYNDLKATIQVKVEIPKPKVTAINITPKYPTTTDKVQFSFTSNMKQDEILNVEWNNKKDFYPEGTHTVKVRIQNKYGTWSDWFSYDFVVQTSKTTTKPFIEPPIDNQKVETIMIENLTKTKPASFTDIQNHWAKNSIELSQQLKLVAGYEGNVFKPNNLITREEFAVIVARAFQISPSYNDYPFKDEAAAWSKPYITALYELKLVNGYPDGRFGYQNKITRAEIVSILSRLLNVNEVPLYINQHFSDIQNHWAKSSIQTMAAAGIIYGKTDSTFNPNDNATRAETVVILLRMLNLNINIKNALQSM